MEGGAESNRDPVGARQFGDLLVIGDLGKSSKGKVVVGLRDVNPLAEAGTGPIWELFAILAVYWLSV